MTPTYLTPTSINQFIEYAFLEDVGEGDHSSLSSIPASAQGRAKLIVKGEGVIAGIQLAQAIFDKKEISLQSNILKRDGDLVKFGDIAFTVEGSIHAILKAERLVLNCMQRMSGIATMTAHFNNIISGTSASLLDTRKTTPNFRLPEKWAVFIGGGTNHRYGLFDMIILKDNHVDYAGGISNALKAAKNYIKENNKSLKIEIETRNLAEVKEACEEGGFDRIMLDNMTPDSMREAVNFISGKFETEASGGVNESNIREVAETGVDFISVGALTHSVKSMDMSLKAY